MKMNHDIIKKFGKKAGFDELMNDPIFKKMLTTYTDMVTKQLDSVDENYVKIEIKAVCGGALIKEDAIVHLSVIKTMPDILLSHYYGNIALKFREENL
jgi:hypothetical protein